MRFAVGDRVKYTGNSFAIKNGELGTVQIVFDESCGLDAAVRWDEYNQNRHSNDGECETGHGWLVSGKYLEHVCEYDYGELPEERGTLIDNFLFGV